MVRVHSLDPKPRKKRASPSSVTFSVATGNGACTISTAATVEHGNFEPVLKIRYDRLGSSPPPFTSSPGSVVAYLSSVGESTRKLL